MLSHLAPGPVLLDLNYLQVWTQVSHIVSRFWTQHSVQTEFSCCFVEMQKYLEEASQQLYSYSLTACVFQEAIRVIVVMLFPFRSTDGLWSRLSGGVG